MPCRDTPIAGVVQTVARSDRVDDVQMLSMYAEMRRQGRDLDAVPPTAGEWSDFLDDLQRSVGQLPVSEQRRAQMLEKVAAARAGATPDGPTFYAAKHATARARTASIALQATIRQAAVSYDADQETVHQAVRSLIAWNRGHRRGDNPPAPPETLPYDPSGVPGDRATRWALAMVHAHGPSVAQDTSTMAAGRDTLEATIQASRCDACGEFTGRAGHLCPSSDEADREVRAHRRTPIAATGLPVAPPTRTDGLPTRPGFVPSPRVPQELIEDLPAGPDETVVRVGPLGMIPAGARRYPGAAGGHVRMLNVSALRDLLNRNREQVITTHVEAAHVSGDVMIVDNAEPEARRYSGPPAQRYTVEPVLEGETMAGRVPLRCTCADYQANYDCEHVRAAVTLVRDTLAGRPAAVAPTQVLEQVHAELLAGEEAARTAGEAARARVHVAEPVASYSDNMEAFQRDWDEIKARFDGDRTAPITFNPDSAGTERTIGLEIETDFPDEESHRLGTTRNLVAAQLHREGLSHWSEHLTWHPFGAGRRLGDYSNDAAAWSLSHDQSVDELGGRRGTEIVSPILRDTPETWRNVGRILQIVREHGGQMTQRHGLHVNIGAADFNHTIDNHRRLLRMGQVYEDVLLRAATNPASGSAHRGRRYCRAVGGPNGSVDSAEGFVTIARAREVNNHYQMINLAAVPAERESVRNSTRVEFRMFDGTSDAGRVQAATRMALGMMEAAKRAVPLPAETMAAGWHRAQFSVNGRMPRLSGERWEANTASMRRFADTIYQTHEDKKQFLELMYTSTWQRP